MNDFDHIRHPYTTVYGYTMGERECEIYNNLTDEIKRAEKAGMHHHADRLRDRRHYFMAQACIEA